MIKIRLDPTLVDSHVRRSSVFVSLILAFLDNSFIVKWDFCPCLSHFNRRPLNTLFGLIFCAMTQFHYCCFVLNIFLPYSGASFKLKQYLLEHLREIDCDLQNVYTVWFCRELCKGIFGACLNWYILAFLDNNFIVNWSFCPCCVIP